MKEKIKTAMILVSILTIFSCSTAVEPYLIEDLGEVGTAFELEYLKSYSRSGFKFLNLLAGKLINKNSIVNGASLYRMTYYTTNYDGQTIKASALVTIPDRDEYKGYALYLHGTNVDRNSAPSAPTLYEGVLASMIFSSGEYIMIAPDYIGLGVSETVHPYLYTPSQVTATTDCLKAISRLLDDNDNRINLYITGFSQGARVALGVHKDIEASYNDIFQVIVNAAVAGPYFIEGYDNNEEIYSFENAMYGSEISHALYLAYIGNSFCNIKKYPTEELFAPEWNDVIPEYFSGNYSSDEVWSLFSKQDENGEDVLAITPSSIFTREFRDEYYNYRNNGGEMPWLISQLIDYSVTDWNPESDIRLFYGELDVDVLPQESLKAKEALGENCKLINVGEYGHDDTMYVSIQTIREWFDSK